jgi:hypothetical protein
MMAYNTNNVFQITGLLRDTTPSKTTNGKDVTLIVLVVDDRLWDKASGAYADKKVDVGFSIYGKKRETAEDFKGRNVTISFRLDSYNNNGKLYDAKAEVIKIEMAAIPEAGTRLSDAVDFSTPPPAPVAAGSPMYDDSNDIPF